MDEFKNLTTSFGDDWIASATISPTLEDTVVATQVISRTLNPHLTIDIPLVFIAITFLLVVRFWIDKKSADNPRDPSINEQNQNANPSLPEKKDIQNLTIEDWAGLYNKTFDSDPDHRMVLKSEHISTSTASTEFGAEGDTDIESGQDKSNKSIHEDDAPSYSLILDALTGRNKARVGKNVPEISGTCVICFEEFEAGDEVVWSSITPSDENPATMTSEEITASRHGSCQHVYHQDCMVQYLASHTYRKFRKIHLYGDVPERGKDIETPCPTCRRDFCTICDEDLGVAIKTRCLELEEETSSHTSANSIEGSTDEEESQEGLSASESTTQEQEEHSPVAPLEEEQV